MKPEDWFGIILRAFGLMLSVYAAWFLVYAIAEFAGMPEATPGERIQYLVSGLFTTAVGAYLLRGAPHVMRFAYPESAERTDRMDSI